MGLFSRSDSSPKSGRRAGSRAPATGDAQTNELRGRARRRLIGALVLVVAAIIILPMLFDNAPDGAKAPVVAQVVIPSPPQPNTTQPVDTVGDTGAQETLPAPEAIEPDDSGSTKQPASPSGETSAAPSQSTSRSAGKTESAKPEKTPDQASNTEKAKASDDSGASAKTSTDKPDSGTGKVKRTDDGSVALALLQGRTPSKTDTTTAPEQGNFVLQIAAYTTDEDAQVRRKKLIAAGVTNAYVEHAMSSGKSVYRLRVGPFSSRDAAQAAQARLRALGYDNGFISTK